ncbi:Sin3 associated polypeptide p18, partial [Anaeromyces robustus]
STVDREKVCPFLLRVFCKRGNHHRIEDFTINRQPVEDEVQVYTWKDASLRELASLLAEVDPKYAKHGTTLSFKAVYLDSIRARYNSKDLGVINVSKPSKTDDVTLDDNRFIIGDFIDVAI